MDTFGIFQLLGGAVLAISNIPQLLRIWKQKSAASVSLKSNILAVLGYGASEIYAAHLFLDGVGIYYLVTNTLTILLRLAIIGSIVFFNRQEIIKSLESLCNCGQCHNCMTEGME